MRDADQALIHLDEVEPAAMRRDDGWHDMAIRFVGGEETGCEQACLFRARFPPGAAHEPHLHPHADELYMVLAGRPLVGAGDAEHAIEAGTVHFVRRGNVHWLRNADAEYAVEVVGVYLGVPSLERAGYEPAPRRAAPTR